MACNARKLAPVCIAVCLAMKIYSVMAADLSESFLSVSCPADAIIPASYHNQVNFTISVDWMRPDDIEIFTFWFGRVCLKGNITDSDACDIYEDFRSYHNSTVVDLGTVCLFKGGYTSIIPRNDAKGIRTESCETPALQSTGKAQLNLTCFDSVAAVEVITPGGDAALNYTDLQGRCITPDWRNEKLMEYTRHLESGNSSISDLPDNTICTFYGSYQLQTSEVVDFEPVQCIMNHPSPPTIPLPPTTTEDVTTTTTTTAATSTSASEKERTTTSISATSTKSATASISATTTESATTSISATTTENATASISATSTKSATASTSATTTESATTSTSATSKGIVSSWQLVVLISFMVVMAIVITLALMAAACLACKWYHWKMRREQKKQLHIWDLNSKENLDQEPHIFPQFPHAPDSLSIATDIECLYKEEERTLLSNTSLSSLTKSMKNDEKAIDSPKLIMDRFLNGCHQRVWESSHESLSNVPPSSSQDQGSSKLSGLHCAKTGAICGPVPSKSNSASDSDNVMARRYTLNTNQQYKLDDSVTKYADDNHTREFTPSSVPTENYFTDDEGYLRFTNETAL